MILLALVGPLLTGRLGGVTVCPTAGLLGLPCPGCGLSRATVAALGGDLEAALHYHPLFFVIVPLYGAAVLHVLVTAALGRRMAPTPRWVDGWLSGVSIALVALATGVWLLRFAGFFGGPVEVASWFSRW